MTLGLLWGIWAAINVIVFVLYGVDKRRAIRGAWRVPEKTLLTGTWLLGGVGALAGAAVTPVNLAVCAFLIGFGGISVAMQTAAVLDGTNIKVSRHLVGRLLNGSISAFLIYTLGSAVL